MTNIQKWFLISAIWVLILFSIFAFYWLLIRPARVRNLCSERARQVSAGANTGLKDTLEINRAIYLECLRCHGIER